MTPLPDTRESLLLRVADCADADRQQAQAVEAEILRHSDALIVTSGADRE